MATITSGRSVRTTAAERASVRRAIRRIGEHFGSSTPSAEPVQAMTTEPAHRQLRRTIPPLA